MDQRILATGELTFPCFVQLEKLNESKKEMENPILRQGLSLEARKYAIKELARRAGASRDFYATWKVTVESDQTILTLLPDGNKRVLFPHASDDIFRKISAGNIPFTEAAWLKVPDDTLLKQSLCLPFVESHTDRSLPLFLPSENGSFLCSCDVLFSLLCTLSRVEEMIPGTRDEHARFPAAASVAVQRGFLERPIVDEYGLAFEQVLSALLPSWKSERPALRAKLTHDIDHVGIPFQFRTAIGHTLKRREPLATLRDLASTFTPIEPIELALVRALADISKARGFQSAFFWKGSVRTPMDAGYDPFHPKVQRVISHLKEQGFELGVHPGYSTFGSKPALQSEVALLRKALGVQEVGGRQHYLRWSPQTWLDWESSGLAYDSSVGFADFIGFRAGTAFPYRPWSLAENRELNLIEVPLIVMDCTPVKYMGLSREEGLARIRNCIHRTAVVGGVFTLLWHNAPLLEPEYDGWYESILNLLPPGQNFGLPQSPQSFW